MRGAAASRWVRRSHRFATRTALAWCCAGPALAQWGGSIAAESDYRFRGVSLTDARPGVRLTLNLDTAAGWYGGAAAEGVQPSAGERYTQILAYAGHVSPVIDGRSFEAGGSRAHFTGEPSYDYTELYAGVLAERWSLRAHFAPRYFGREVRTLYIEGGGHLPMNQALRLFAHVGVLASRPGGSNAGRNEEARRTRSDLRLGAGWALQDADLQLAWVAATRGGPYPAVYGGRASTWQLSASYSF